MAIPTSAETESKLTIERHTAAEMPRTVGKELGRLDAVMLGNPEGYDDCSIDGVDDRRLVGLDDDRRPVGRALG